MGTGGSWVNPKAHDKKVRDPGSQRTGKRRGGVIVEVYGRLREMFVPDSGASAREVQRAERRLLAEWTNRRENQRVVDSGPDRHPGLNKASAEYVHAPEPPLIPSGPLPSPALYGHPYERPVPRLSPISREPAWKRAARLRQGRIARLRRGKGC